MDDAHAHPLSPAHGLHVRSRSIPPSLRDYRPNNVTPKSAPHTHQQRLLQTRHARFSAQSLSVNSVNNVPFLQLNRSVENESPYFPSPRFDKRDENDKIRRTAEDLSHASTESAILNEISSFNAYRIRGLKRRAAIPVFEDSPDKHSNPPSVYHDASSDIQAYSIPDSLQDSPSMGLREVSVNIHRPSPGKDSPYSRSVRGGLGRKSSQAKARFNPNDYIEHIENELQSTRDSMYSPTTHLPWKEKLKKAKDEIYHLKKEMESVKASFEFELHQTVEQSTETELTLKRRIKDLEGELELKQTLIHDLECDREEDRFDQSAQDVLRARIEKLEEEKLSLETTNRDMTRRNEVLTQLLALSPTKTQYSIDLPTPRRRSARPMSLIIPRIPSSPGIRTAQSHSRPQSVLVSPALRASDYFGEQIPSSPFASSPGPLGDTRSIDSGLGESCGPIASGTGSRQSTLASHASTSPGMDVRGHTRAESRPQTVLCHPSKRRPRKFMPGSTQLKPLLLPTFTAENGNLPFTSPVTSPTRNFPVQVVPRMTRYDPPSNVLTATDSCSETASSSPEHVIGRPGPAFQSLDEVFAEDQARFQVTPLEDTANRLSFSDQLRRYETPIQNRNFPSIDTRENPVESHSHPRINSWVLKTVSPLVEDEGDHSHFHSLDSLALDGDPDIPRPLFSKYRTTGHRPASNAACSESPLNPRRRRKTNSSLASIQLPTALEDRVSAAVQPCTTDHHGQSPASSSTDVKIMNPLNEHGAKPSRQASVRARNPLEMLQHHGVATRPLATLTIRTVYATLSRYTTYIQGFNRDPLALARRVIANAWRSNWAMFGRLSWWVLGLFIGYRRPHSPHVAWEWENYDGESIADRHCSPALQSGLTKSSCPGGKQNSLQFSGDDDEGPATDPHALPPPTSSSSKEPKGGWGQSLFLWGKFSVAIMLAVGGAIVKGPAEMLRDADERRRSRSSSLVDGAASSHRGEHVLHSDADSRSVTGRPQYQRGGPAHSVTPLEGNRKARSLSSPPTSPESHRRVLQVPADPSASDFLCTNDETLKPARNERKAVHSVFHAPENVGLGDTPGRDFALSDPAAWHGRIGTQNASGSGWSATTAVPERSAHTTVRVQLERHERGDDFDEKMSIR